MPAISPANKWLHKFYSRHSAMDQLLIISVLFSLSLFAARLVLTKLDMFAFLPWNLFLAFVPLYISGKLTSKPAWIEDLHQFIPIFLAWLLFIPNSFYILTDLFHLEVREESSRWFDLVMIFSFAW